MLKMENNYIKMDRKVLRIFIFLIYVKPEADLVIATRKINYQKDMSEYCRRRVAPSVFLGKQVMEASSHIMHFSQLEVPYSCTLSVRTEFGNNIILVIQLLSADNLLEACARNTDQLIIYELGETFGGYWGHIPGTMIMKTTRNYTQFYTQKTTKHTTVRRTRTYKTDSSEKLLVQTTRVATERPGEYIRMEIPLVNVSGNFQLGPPLQAYNAEEMFDFIYDVTPRNGVEYETSVLPLVQFSIKKQEVGEENYNMEPRFDLDYAVNGLTFDSRLLFSTNKQRATTRKRNWPTSRRLNFRKKIFHKLLTPKPVSHRSFTKTVLPTLDSSTWKIEDLMKSFSITTMPSTMENNNTIRHILHKISNLDHNISVYLAPNISMYEKYKTNNFITNSHSTELSTTVKSSNRSYSIKDRNQKTLNLEKLGVDDNNIQKFALQTDFDISQSSDSIKDQSIKVNDENGNKVTTYMITTVKRNAIHTEKTDNTNIVNKIKHITEKFNLLQRGTMVDHESWENVVQAAPVMAVILNKSEIIGNKSYQDREGLAKSDRRNKKKRHIQALDIEDSRPRNLTTKRELTTEAETDYQFSDMQDIAGQVELQDDEIAGRLALRYLRNYVGPVLFNICDFQEAKSRQVTLFNASRIVITINNFTLEGMTLILTPAQSIPSGVSLCENGHLECQIIGSRVCIDSMNACDAVPNCGSYDIYDEDRLKCGVTKGLQHNVYLAAFTFLAVILTMLYTIHYWLKRCVPGVSDAFFIYTDASENTLFLETIMRSPTDGDETSYKFAYPGHFFDNDILYEDGFKEADLEENCCRKALRKCLGLLFCKKKRDKSPGYIDEPYNAAPMEQSKVFSFTEFELRKFAQASSKDKAVQTGDSIEINLAKYKRRKKDDIRQNVLQDSIDDLKIINGQRDHDKYAEELNLLKYAKETRSLSLCNKISDEQRDLGRLARRHALVATDEKEIKSTVYERESNISDSSEKIRVKCEVHPEIVKKNFDTQKRLRFDEELTMIPSMESGGEMTVNTMGSRRSVIFGREGHSSRDLDKITQVERSEGNGSRDFMRFWGTSKGKRGGKKKKEKRLPMRFN